MVAVTAYEPIYGNIESVSDSPKCENIRGAKAGEISGNACGGDLDLIGHFHSVQSVAFHKFTKSGYKYSPVVLRRDFEFIVHRQ